VTNAIKGLPQGNELMHGFYGEAPGPLHLWEQRPWEWHFHRAYLQFSETNRLSRSLLVSTVTGLFQALKDARAALTSAQQQDVSHTRLYQNLTSAYDDWHTFTKEQAHVPLAAVEARQLTGRGRERLPGLGGRSAPGGRGGESNKEECRVSQLLEQISLDTHDN
jgi:hypothetical protein